MTATERRAFLAVVDAVCAPEPPLPPVHATDAAEAFERWLAGAPRRNRVALRAALRLTAHARPCNVGGQAPGVARRALVAWLGRLGQLGEGLRVSAAGCYYGDAQVMRLLGYDAGEVVRRARA